MSEHNLVITGTSAGGALIPAGTDTPWSDDAVALTPSITFSTRALELLKWVFSFPSVLGAALVGLAFNRAGAFLVDPDMWWHIKTGETILATHHWPTTDPYSFPVFGQHWIAFEWLGDILIATASRIGGLRGLELLSFLIGSAILLSLYLLGTISSGKSKAGFLAAALLSPLVITFFNVRPQMLGYLFIVFTLIALELFRQGKRWALWTLPPLFLIWVNTHGSWIVGLGIIFVYWMCGLAKFRVGAIEAERWSPNDRLRISLVFLLSLIAVTITPYGTELTFWPLVRAVSFPISDGNVSEWMSIFMFTGLARAFLVVVFAFFMLQITLGLVWRFQELVFFIGGSAWAFFHARFLIVVVPFFALILARVLARWVGPYMRGKDKYLINGILLAGLLAAMIHYSPARTNLEKKVADSFPVKAVDYLRQHPTPGPMLNSYNFGGYLIWSRGPEQKVFMDGRAEIYEQGGVLADYFAVTRLKTGGLSVLQAYHIQSCLLQRGEPLTTVLSALPDWRLVYSDHTSALFVRRNSLPASTPESAQYSPERRE